MADLHLQRGLSAEARNLDAEIEQVPESLAVCESKVRLAFGLQHTFFPFWHSPDCNPKLQMLPYSHTKEDYHADKCKFKQDFQAGLMQIERGKKEICVRKRVALGTSRRT